MLSGFDPRTLTAVELKSTVEPLAFIGSHLREWFLAKYRD